jgi:ribosomal protein L16 Arg81 hydroxylase
MRETDRQVLESFLSPLEPARFLERFTLEPVVIKGSVSKFAGLLDVPRLERIIQRLPPSADGTIRAAFPSAPLSPVNISPAQVGSLFDAGATICITHIHQYDAGLAQFAAAIKGELNYTGHVGFNCYWSPDGSGFRTHYDARTATTLQLEGRKLWGFSRQPAMRVPTRNAQLDSVNRRILFRGDPTPLPWENLEYPDESAFDQVLLEPGDVFSLPAGHWHWAAANGFSLALNLAFQAESFLDVLIETAVAEIRQDPAMRNALPMVVGAQDQLPRPARDQVARLIGALRAKIDALDPDSPALLDAWRSAVSTIRMPLQDPGLMAVAGRVEAHHRLRVMHDAPHKVFFEEEEGKRRVVLFYNGTKLSLPAQASALIETLLGQESFVASEALAWGKGYKWEQLHPFLLRLAEYGLLRRVTP